MAAGRKVGRDRTLKSNRRSSRAGQTIVEVIIAVAFLTIALCGITGSIVASDRLRGVNRETALAQEGVRATLEALNGIPFQSVFSLYNSTTADDPVGVTPPGANFAVRGLRAAPDDADGFPGEISFPTLDVAGVLQLRDDVTDAGLGMPRDLDMNPLAPGIDAIDHATDYRILPVRVRVRWSGATGIRVMTTETVLCAR